MSIRVEKVASLMKHELGNILTRKYNSSDYGFITVTEVHMTSDLKLAKIYISILGNSDIKTKTMKMLELEKKNIRTNVGSHLKLKYTPELQFFLDETLDRVDNINRILKKIHENDSKENHQ